MYNTITTEEYWKGVFERSGHPELFIDKKTGKVNEGALSMIRGALKSAATFMQEEFKKGNKVPISDFAEKALQALPEPAPAAARTMKI